MPSSRQAKTPHARIADLLALPWTVAALAVAARLVLGVALLAAYGEAFPQSSDDGDSYDAAARWLVFGDATIHGRLGEGLLDTSTDPSARWPSGYWLFLAGLYSLFGHQFGPALAIQAAVGAAGVVAFYALARRVVTRPVAAVSTYLVAFSGTLVVLSSTIAAEALYIPHLLLGLWAAVRATEARNARRQAPWLGLSGALFGLAEVTRPVALPIFVLVLAWLVGRALRASRPRAATLPLLAFVGFLVAVAPFAARDLAVLGRVALFTAGGAEALHDSADGDDLTDRLARLGVDPYRLGLEPSVAALAARPIEIGRTVAESLPDRLATVFLVGGWGPVLEPLPQALGPAAPWLRAVGWILALMGAASLLRPVVAADERRSLSWLLLLYTLAVVLPFLLLGKPLVRYRVPADPVFVLWTVAGVVLVARLLLDATWARARESPRHPAEADARPSHRT